MLGSILFWFPFVRRITGSIKQITSVTEKIADEDFTVRVVIEDEGPGVPEEVIDKLFDRFLESNPTVPATPAVQALEWQL